jgi:hypothetical protein
MAANAPVPGDDTVPSARAERRRAWSGDTKGVWLYSCIVTVLSLIIISIVVFS